MVGGCRGRHGLFFDLNWFRVGNGDSKSGASCWRERHGGKVRTCGLG